MNRRERTFSCFYFRCRFDTGTRNEVPFLTSIAELLRSLTIFVAVRVVAISRKTLADLSGQHVGINILYQRSQGRDRLGLRLRFSSRHVLGHLHLGTFGCFLGFRSLEFRRFHDLFVQSMNHIDKQTFIFVQSVFSFSEQVFRRFFVQSFAPRDHLHDFRVNGI